MSPVFRRVLEITSVAAVVAFWTIDIFFVRLTDLFTPFLVAPILFGSLCGIFVLAVVWTIVLFATRPFSWRSLWSLAICVVALALFFLIPVSTLEERYDFQAKHARLDAAAQRIAAQSATDGILSLPPAERDLSDSGEAYVTEIAGRRYVLFWYYRGILDDSEAFAYVPPGGSISALIDGGDASVDERLSAQWYAVYGD